MACVFPNYLAQNHLNDLLLLPKQQNDPDSGIHNICTYRESRNRLYARSYGEGLPLKHVPKILGKPKPPAL